MAALVFGSLLAHLVAPWFFTASWMKTLVVYLVSGICAYGVWTIAESSMDDQANVPGGAALGLGFMIIVFYWLSAASGIFAFIASLSRRRSLRSEVN